MGAFLFLSAILIAILVGLWKLGIAGFSSQGIPVTRSKRLTGQPAYMLGSFFCTIAAVFTFSFLVYATILGFASLFMSILSLSL